MLLHSRSYQGMDDLHRLIQFLQESNALGSLRGYFHVGDLVWGIYQSMQFDPHANIHIWEDIDRVSGFVWFDQPYSAIFQVHPALRDSTALRESMLAWATSRAQACQGGAEHPRLETRIWVGDPQTMAFFGERGFVPTSEYSVNLSLRLEAPLAPTIPDGFAIRPISGSTEWSARVDLYQAVWNSSGMTHETYQRLQTAPIYNPDLDFVVVAPNGRLVALCTAWLDAANQVGECEPVGTHPDYRGMGIGRALLQTTLQRMHGCGAREAIIYADGTNTPAIQLYQSLGFQAVTREDYYQRQLGSIAEGGTPPERRAVLHDG